MTKKKVMMAAMSTALVAVVGVGGTLAYLSSKSEEVTNTFEVGTGFIPGPDNHQALWLDETDVDNSNTGTNLPNQGRDLANNYTDFNPGDIRTKDPIVYLTNGSVESYVFVKVTGVDALEDIMAGGVQAFEVTGWDNTYWTPVEVSADGKDGIYVANGGQTIDLSSVKEGEEGFGEYVALGRSDKIVPVFQNVKMSSELTSMPDTTDVEDGDITIEACAVQYSADSMNSYNDALAAAKDAAGWK